MTLISDREKTEVWQGVKDVASKALQVLYKVQDTLDLCTDVNGPSVILTNEIIAEAYVNLYKRQVKVRFITEITHDNIRYCKDMMKIAELRHLDGIKGSFAIADGTDYSGVANTQEAQPITQLIVSNVKAFVDQQKYFFETLWSKSTPAEQRIREIEENKSSEKTAVEYGIENATGTIVRFLSRASRSIDICADRTWPSVAMGVPVFREAMLLLKTRKIKCRFVTEFTKDNLAFCKQLMNIAEVRHLDIKGNFAISEQEYIASATMKAQQLLPQVIYSNSKEIVEQQQYIFETLWSKAIPAQQRIREIEEGVVRSETRVLSQPEEILTEITRLNNHSNEISVCATSGGLQFTHNFFFDVIERLLERHRKGEHRGIRYLTNINTVDLPLVRKFLELGMQIRHVKNVTPISFAVSDKEMGATIEKIEEGKIMQSLLMSNESLYVQHFQLIFEELWKNGIDAAARIKEIEQGVEPADIEILHNPQEALRRAWGMIKNSKHEVLLMFSTTRAFERQLQMGGLQIIKEAIKSGTKVRVLLPADEQIKNITAQLSTQLPQVEFRIMDKSLQTKITILAVDSSQCMLFELKDDTKQSSYEAVGLSMHSSSKTIVLSYVSIFDSLWKQTELYEQLASANKQLKIHDKMQQEFINIAAHELRTPIQPILGMAEMLEAELGNKSEEIRMIVRNARRLEELSRNILDVSKIQSQSLKLDMIEFNLNDVILDAVEDCSDQIADSKVKLLYQPADIFVRADKGRITQVISNLLDNALKFTEEGTVTVQIQKKDREILVSVSDSGTGIDPEIMPRLFTKFTTKSARGTGLGLFISKSIIEAHGGRIWAKNRDDGGATLLFTLPALQ